MSAPARARWLLGGEVLAYLNTDVGTARKGEEHGLLGEPYRRSGITELVVLVGILQRGKPPFLVELAVVGQIGLRHKGAEAATGDHCRTVEQQLAGIDRHSNDDGYVATASELHKPHDGFLGLVDEQPLCKQILTAIAGDTQLGENHGLHVHAASLFDLLLYLGTVVVHISYFYAWHRCGHSY